MINLTTLENGFRVATDEMTDVETIAVSLAIKIGSRFEEEGESGISHFLEHMAFKGTQKRNALAIAKEIEMVGGCMNAYTSKEMTVYYIVVLKEHLNLAIDLLADIIQNSSFLQEEIERERGVILEELASGEDTPDDIVFDYYFETLFKNQPLGRPIIGNRKTISSFQKSDFINYIGTKYNAGNMVLSVAGKVKHQDVLTLAEKFFSSLGKAKEVEFEKANYIGGEFKKNNKDLTQAQFLLGFKGFPLLDQKTYALKIANNILGGGMSSRLFQEVREKRGLVYTVSSFENTFFDTGIFGIYAGTSAQKIPELEKVLEGEIEKIQNHIEEEEIAKTITQVKSSLLMALESTKARSQRLASNILFRGRYIPNSEIMENFEKVTESKIKAVMKEVFESPKTFVVYGNLENL